MLLIINVIYFLNAYAYLYATIISYKYYERERSHAVVISQVYETPLLCFTVATLKKSS
jgi:hypothetical protein